VEHAVGRGLGVGRWREEGNGREGLAGWSAPVGWVSVPLGQGQIRSWAGLLEWAALVYRFKDLSN
jgi:hypothetical protein